MKKRGVFVFLMLSLVLVSAIDVRAATEGPYTYTANANGTATITGYSSNVKDVVIPGTLGGLPVVSIGAAAFDGDRLTSVVIPDSVTSLGNGAFQNNNLTSVTLSKNLTSLPYRAFYKNAITSVTLPEGMTTIGEEAFWINQMKTVVIPDSVTRVDKYAFQGNLLETVTLSKNLTIIDEGVFFQNKLVNFTIPSYITSVGSWSFEENLLAGVTILNTNLTFGDGVFSTNPAGLTLYGYDNSTTKTYANQKGHNFVILSEPPPQEPPPEEPPPEDPTVPGDVTVQPGSLGFSNNLLLPFVLDIILDGTDQIVSTLMEGSIDVVDARGTHTGWNVEMSVSDFISESGIISKSNFLFSALNTVVADGITGPEGQFSGEAPFAVISLGEGKGYGTHTLDLSGVVIELLIPRSTKQGNYSGTVTISLVTNP